MPRRDDHGETRTKSTDSIPTAPWCGRGVPRDEDDPERERGVAAMGLGDERRIELMDPW